MSAGPPPDAVILAVGGLRGPADQAAVLAAITRCDPAARSWADWSRGFVAVASALPPRTLQEAVQSAGYVTTLAGGPAPAPRGSVLGVFGRMILYALIGGMVGVALGVGLGLANSFLNPDCTRPGSSGNCAIGVGIFGMLLGLIGVPVGAIAGLVHGLVRRRG